MASHTLLFLIAAACVPMQALALPATTRHSIQIKTTRHAEARDMKLATPIPPTQDPFYSPTEGFQTASPGTVLRIRETPGNLTTLAGANCSAAYNIVYRTANSRYEADYAVTTLFVPASPSAALLSYQVPYDSAYLDASPSYALYSTDGASWMQDVSTALSRGWFVSVPDYEGPLASFTAGVQSGHATLDSVRAVLRANASNGLGLPPETRAAMWGYSGGALASEWAAELQVQYAPELGLSGAALGGLTPNVSSVLLSIDGQIDAGLSPSAFLGLSSQYPRLRRFLLSTLKTTGPYNATGFLAAENYTSTQAFEAFAFQNITEYFVDGISDLLGPLALSIANIDGQMGYHGVPQMPIYAYKAIADEVSIVNDTDALVDRYCSVGANILYDRNTIGGHAAEEVNGKPAALSFLQSILSGMNATGFPSSGCKTQDVSVNITDSIF